MAKGPMKVGTEPLAQPEDAIIGAKSAVEPLAPPEGAATPTQVGGRASWHSRRARRPIELRVPVAKVVRQQPVRQAKSKRTGKR